MGRHGEHPAQDLHNPGATFTGAAVVFEAGKIVFGPNRGIPVLRWKAPSRGTVAARFNTETTLSVEIDPGPNTADFVAEST